MFNNHPTCFLSIVTDKMILFTIYLLMRLSWEQRIERKYWKNCRNGHNENGYRIIFMNFDTRSTCFHPLVLKYLSVRFLLRHFFGCSIWTFFPFPSALSHLPSTFSASLISFFYLLSVCIMEIFSVKIGFLFQITFPMNISLQL